MTDTKGKGTLARRDLFRAAGLGVGVLGAAAVGLPAATAEAKTTDDRTAQRYRETEHVRKAYESSRF